jgi:PAS domain S-box-containing protein
MDIGQALIRISEQLFGDFEPSHVYNRIVQITLAEFQADCASLVLWDEETQHIAMPAVVGKPCAAPTVVPGAAHSHLADWVLKQRNPVLLLGDNNRLAAFDALLCGQRAHSAVCAPMFVRDHPIGVLSAARQQGRNSFTTADSELLLLLARQAAIMVENTQFFDRAQRQAAYMAQLNELGSILAAQINLDPLLRAAAAQLALALPGASGYLCLHWNERQGRLQQYPIGEAGPARGTLDGKRGLVAQVLSEGVSQIVRDVSRATMLAPWERQLIKAEAQTLICSPMTTDSGIVGAILLVSPTARPFGGADLTFLNGAARLIGRSAERAHSYERLIASAAHYRAMIDQARDAVLVLDGNAARIVEANPAAETLSGYSQAELCALPAADVFIGAFLERRAVPSAQSSPRDHTEIEAHLRTRAGRELPISVGMSEFAYGEARYLLLIVRDISERQRAVQRLTQTEKLAGMGRLATSIAHEINNPLQAIHNSLHLVLTRPLSEEKRDRYLGMAHEEVERLITMVQRMLDFYRPSRDGMRPISLHAILENVLVMTAEQFRESAILVEQQWDERLPWVKGIGSHLKQVFLNLALNAIEAMPDGGRLTVRTRVETRYPDLAERFVLVEFIDTGPGIPDQEAQTIFEPFYTTKNKGPGLGLAISYSIIERHEGTLSVSSSSAGTIFRVALPAIEASELVAG